MLLFLMMIFKIVLRCCSKLISKIGIMDIRVVWLVSPNIFPPVFGRNFPFTPILPGSLFLSHLKFPFHSSLSFPPSVVSFLLFSAWFVCFLPKGGNGTS